MAGLPFHRRDDLGREGLCSVSGDSQGARGYLCDPDFTLSKSGGLAGPAAWAVVLVGGEPSHQHLSSLRGWWGCCPCWRPSAVQNNHLCGGNRVPLPHQPWTQLAWLYTATASALKPEDVIQRELLGKGPTLLGFSLLFFPFLLGHLHKAFPWAITSTLNKPRLCFLAVLSDFRSKLCLQKFSPKTRRELLLKTEPESLIAFNHPVAIILKTLW